MSFTSMGWVGTIVNLAGCLFSILWFYAIGVYGQEKIEKMGLPSGNVMLFTINLILIPVLVIILNLLTQDEPGVSRSITLDFETLIIIPIAFYLTFAIIHVVYFVGKTIAAIELKNRVTTIDNIFTSILIVMLMVGIWIIQPKVTRLIYENEPTVNS